ncbi:MAG: hypothetical protein KatS3mg056_3148 [Chloroflexus sp.]|nr:MAG: hypothetical protein KatS3mg056_3148 [Chloroflexus sp.]
MGCGARRRRALPGDADRPPPYPAPAGGGDHRCRGGSRWRELVQSCGTRVEAGVVDEASWRRMLPGDSPHPTPPPPGAGITGAGVAPAGASWYKVAVHGWKQAWWTKRVGGACFQGIAPTLTRPRWGRGSLAQGGSCWRELVQVVKCAGGAPSQGVVAGGERAGSACFQGIAPTLTRLAGGGDHGCRVAPAGASWCKVAVHGWKQAWWVKRVGSARCQGIAPSSPAPAGDGDHRCRVAPAGASWCKVAVHGWKQARWAVGRAGSACFQGIAPTLTRPRWGRGSPVQGGSRWRELVQVVKCAGCARFQGIDPTLTRIAGGGDDRVQ